MQKQERVQFFNSQSSFGSESSLASSRYFDLTNQIAEQTDSIMLTLQKEFMPTKELTNFQKIEYLHNRAKILSNDTIPDHIQYLHKISSPKQSREILTQCSKRLQKLIKDFQSLKNGTMLHKQFYNIYGRSMQNNVFFKKDNVGVYENGGMMEPDVQQLDAQRSSRGINNNKLTARTNLVAVANTQQTQKQLKELQQQVVRLRRRQKQLRRQFEQQLTTQRLNTEKRINVFLKTLAKSSPTMNQELETNYRNQATYLNEELQKEIKEKEEAVRYGGEMEKRVRGLEQQNEALREELAGYRRMESSRVGEQDLMDQSFQSEQGEQGNGKKLSNVIKKLTAQRDLLRNQLTKQRQLKQRQKLSSTQSQAHQLSRLKSCLAQRNLQTQELHRQLDKLRVQLIQQRQQNKVLNKSISSIKDTSQQLKRRAMYDTSPQSNNLIVFNKDKSKGVDNTSILDNSSVTNAHKLNSFNTYEGEGIEGFPYFELLSKEFRTRFKRACLKAKELLYKGNGLEIGVITQFQMPNRVKVLLHITNSSDIDIKEMKLKAMNPNQNKVELQVEEIKQLLPGQQLKVPLQCTIKNYPIGPVVLVLDYASQAKHNLRLLLPVHIFKCVAIEPCKEQFYNSTKVQLKTQKKICKDFENLKEYLNSVEQDRISVRIKHQHSSSSLYLQANLANDVIQLQYQPLTGNQKFTDYFIKTFKALLQKHN